MVATEIVPADDAETDSPALETEPVGDGAEPADAKARDGSLVPAGRVEVRILRARPDLVGELRGKPSAPAVEFVAFLATHGYRATMLRLRDGLGTARPRETSQAPTTVWAASGAARRALGEDLVPQAAGNQTYTLSDEVTCDWLRFQQLVAHASDEEADDFTAGRLLEEALGLVDEVPACGTRRFSFLETEGMTTAILAEVVATAERLSAIANATGSGEQALLAQQKLHLFGGEVERSG